jgi:hypothetical protein
MLEDEMQGESRVGKLEHCLVVSGRDRIRVSMLFRSSGGRDVELDMEVCTLIFTCSASLRLLQLMFTT